MRILSDGKLTKCDTRVWTIGALFIYQFLNKSIQKRKKKRKNKIDQFYISYRFYIIIFIIYILIFYINNVKKKVNEQSKNKNNLI